MELGRTAERRKIPTAPIWIGLLLVAATVAAFWRVLGCDFIDFDDPDYFSSNIHVRTGLSLSNVIWAFTTSHGANWHPLTWLSLMLDAELFGQGPLGPHLTNLLLHAANTGLLFLLLRRLTGATWRSAAVAALFALHPLHVESVAWVSERKDVLSAFFGLLSLWAYGCYAQTAGHGGCQVTSDTAPAASPLSRPPSHLYWLAVIFLALGLMSKPMLVTWPLVMLLLDWWPLQRVSSVECRVSSDVNAPAKRSTRNFQVSALIREKWPFFVLSAASCVVTFMVQQEGGALTALMKYPLPARLGNVVVSYARYLGKTLWPVGLANPYPHPGLWPPGLVLFALALVIGLCVAALRLGRRFPFVPVGWFWFAATLVPVIGLVQVGTQSMADRYTYLPLIGVFMVAAWGVDALCTRWRVPRLFVVLLTATVLSACAWRTRDQLSYWQNDEALFRHTLAVTENNYLACVNLGTWLSKSGQIPEAMDLFHQALQMNPDDPNVLYNLGNAFAKIGDWDEAIANYRRALQITPDQADILDNLGFALAARQQYAAAITNFHAALKLDPESASAHNNLATVLFVEQRFEEAAQQYRQALRFAPDNAQIHANLGDTLVRLGRMAEAAQCYQAALGLKPDDPGIKAKLQALGVPAGFTVPAN